MFRLEKRRFWVWFSLCAYGVMILVNALANIIPINNITTGAVSDAYFNLFAPTGLTFAVWGVIYLLLGVYAVRQVLDLRPKAGGSVDPDNIRINAFFAVSSLANIVWIFAWHYRIILLSLFLMLVILACLILISFPLRKQDPMTKAAFGVYFGWITVATIANVTTFLVSVGVPDNTVGATIQTAVILLVGLAIAGLTILIQKNIGYGLVLIWAYLGIYLKHIDPEQFDRGYAAVYNMALFAMIVLILLTAFIVVQPYLSRVKRKRKTAE
ncbi:MAG: hypothetical protein A2Y16_05915 [Tenericutes bacterium GWF2_57_13]|nr:MAG: hypothetical protein A2Y16_05915 [Tenericutes bacterium GWF2_57_13]